MTAETLGALRAEATVVVLGLGNLLRRDEGLGIRAIEHLQTDYILPDIIQVVDGGTLGLDLIAHVEGADYLLVLDAMLTDGPPGTLMRLSGSEIPVFFGIRNSHDVGLIDLLAVMRLRDSEPREVVVLGMQPEHIDLGYDLSLAIEGKMDAFVRAAVDELARWGVWVPSREVTSAVASAHEGGQSHA